MIGVDSSILIDLLRNRPPAGILRYLSEEDQLCTSEIVVHEVLCGIYSARHSTEQRIKEFTAILDSFTFIFPIGRASSVKAAQLAGHLSKAGQTIGHTDALIAGNLLANGCRKFITKNVKDFERIKELELVK